MRVITVILGCFAFATFLFSGCPSFKPDDAKLTSNQRKSSRATTAEYTNSSSAQPSSAGVDQQKLGDLKKTNGQEASEQIEFRGIILESDGRKSIRFLAKSNRDGVSIKRLPGMLLEVDKSGIRDTLGLETLAQPAVNLEKGKFVETSICHLGDRFNASTLIKAITLVQLSDEDQPTKVFTVLEKSNIKGAK